MRRKIAGVFAGTVLAVFVAGPAEAHVTVQPSHAVSGSFSSFAVSVPNEKDDAATTKVEVRFPPLAFVSFEDIPGWNRKVTMRKLDQPIEAFGESIDEVVGTVTWSGGRIEPGEFAEFGFEASLPEGEEQLSFPAIQTYDDGEVVRWVGPGDADQPAATVSTVELGQVAEESSDQLAVLHEVVHELEELSERVDEAQSVASDRPAADIQRIDEDDSNTVPFVLSVVAIALAVIALLVSLPRRRTI